MEFGEFEISCRFSATLSLYLVIWIKKLERKLDKYLLWCIV